MANKSSGRSLLTAPAVAAGIAGLLLALSVFFPWLTPKAQVSASYSSASGMNIALLIGLSGVIGGLAAVGLSFVPVTGLKKSLYIIIGIATIGVLALVIYDGTLPLRSEMVRTYVSTGIGVYIYGLAGLALVIAGIAVKTRATVRPQPYEPAPRRPVPVSQPWPSQAPAAWNPAPVPPPSPAPHRYCGSCGQAVKAGSAFCGVCGHAITAAPPPAVPAASVPPSCPRCGRSCSSAAVYCPGCGAPVKAKPEY